MEASSVLIFSSEQANGLAKAFEQALIDFCGVKLWKEEKENNSGTEALDLLLGATKRYDFALLLLTAADGRSATNGKEPREEGALSTLLFEYGLLIGTIGRERCFLASSESVVLDLLPEVMNGIRPLRFQEPKASDKFQEVIAGTIKSIKTTVQNTGPRKKRTITSELISLDQLFEKEKPQPAGSLINQAGSVVLASLYPGEMVFERARRVRENMKSGIDYAYFFPGDPGFAGKLAQLLQILLLSGRIKAEEAQTRESRFDAIKNQQGNIIDDLIEMCEQDSLRIYFLPREPALQFCIHNANDPEAAVAYLKYDRDYYVQLAFGERHRNDYRLWRDLQLYIPKSSEKQGILHSTVFFSIENSEFRTRFGEEIKKCFPKISNQVEKLCFEGPPL